MKNGLSVDDDLRDCMIVIQYRISSIGGQRQRSQISKVGTKHSQSTEKFVILCHDLSVVGTCLPSTIAILAPARGAYGRGGTPSYHRNLP